MMSKLRWFGFVVLLLAAVAVAWAQDEETPRPAPRAAIAKKDANLIRINGQPTVLLWANGLDNADELEAYAGLGFNTLALSITDVSEEALSQAFDLATAAEERGLLVIGVLAPEGLEDADGNRLAVDPLLPGYAEAVQSFVQKAVSSLDRHPRLIAWVVGGVLPDQVVWGDNGFQTFLRRSYPSVAALNNSWGTSFDDFSRVSTGGVGDIDSARPGGIGRARVDFAYYRAKTYADTIALWTKALRDADPKRLILVGGVTDYRSSISLTSGFDGIIAASTPTAAEPDLVTSNVHGVDIARRANQFIAVQTLDVSGFPAPNQLSNWINLALVHGASGIQFWSWAALRDSEKLGAVVKQTAETLETTHWFPVKPVARAAVLYEPYAGGQMRYGKSLYGYLDGVTEKEPTELFFTVKNGTRYGLMDVLSVDQLGQVDTKQYGAVIAPMAFYLPDDAQAALHQFALLGGALVADAGLGMYQAKGVVDSLPEIMLTTFGLREPTATPLPPPQSQPGVTYQGVTTPTPIGPNGFAADVELEGLLQEIMGILEKPDVEKYLGQEFGGKDGPTLRVRGLGKGFTVYAPAFLYQQWNSEREDFADFHDRILSWGRDVNVIEPDALWPAVTAASYTNKLVAVAAPNNNVTAVDLYFVKNELYYVPGGLVKLWGTETGSSVELLFPGAPLAAAQALPITVTPALAAMVAVAVRQYDEQGIELLINGDGATVGLFGGQVQARGGDYTPLEIVIRDGTFHVASGQSYHVVIQDDGRTVAEYEAMPNPETGAIVIAGRYRGARIAITGSRG